MQTSHPANPERRQISLIVAAADGVTSLEAETPRAQDAWGCPSNLVDYITLVPTWTPVVTRSRKPDQSYRMCTPVEVRMFFARM